MAFLVSLSDAGWLPEGRAVWLDLKKLSSFCSFLHYEIPTSVFSQIASGRSELLGTALFFTGNSWFCVDVLFYFNRMPLLKFLSRVNEICWDLPSTAWPEVRTYQPTGISFPFPVVAVFNYIRCWRFWVDSPATVPPPHRILIKVRVTSNKSLMNCPSRDQNVRKFLGSFQIPFE